MKIKIILGIFVLAMSVLSVSLYVFRVPWFIKTLPIAHTTSVESRVGVGFKNTQLGKTLEDPGGRYTLVVVNNNEGDGLSPSLAPDTFNILVYDKNRPQSSAFLLYSGLNEEGDLERITNDRVLWVHISIPREGCHHPIEQTIDLNRFELSKLDALDDSAWSKHTLLSGGETTAFFVRSTDPYNDPKAGDFFLEYRTKLQNGFGRDVDSERQVLTDWIISPDGNYAAVVFQDEATEVSTGGVCMTVGSDLIALYSHKDGAWSTVGREGSSIIYGPTKLEDREKGVTEVANVHWDTNGVLHYETHLLTPTKIQQFPDYTIDWVSYTDTLLQQNTFTPR